MPERNFITPDLGGASLKPNTSRDEGVAVSSLEMTRNGMRLQGTNEEVDKRLSDIIEAIHNQCLRLGERGGFINNMDGANTAGFSKVAEAMLDQG
jgi:glutamate dehydrogenase (NADP+)